MTEIKIDQLKKFLSAHAYATLKSEKKTELVHLTLKKSLPPASGVCGRKTSNLCCLLFLNGRGDALIESFLPLVVKFKNDPITFAYVHTEQEPQMAKQFGITGASGAVIYKPKRAKYITLQGSNSMEEFNSDI
jgi:hypothetical protein